MPAAIALLLSGLLIIVPVGRTLPITPPESPCPDIFRYEEVSEEGWSAKVILISDSDLDGVWVRLRTRPKLEDIVVSVSFGGYGL